MKKKYRIREGSLLWRLQQIAVLFVLSLITLVVMVAFLNIFVDIREWFVGLL